MIGIVLKLVMILVGVDVFVLSVMSLAKRKLTDVFCMVWGILGVCLILMGILTNPIGISHLISEVGLALIFIGGFSALFVGWCLSVQVSNLTRKNHELAMQVSLLNQEHDRVQRVLKELTGKDADEIWR